jgi:hypothetical protein
MMDWRTGRLAHSSCEGHAQRNAPRVKRELPATRLPPSGAGTTAPERVEGLGLTEDANGTVST